MTLRILGPQSHSRWALRRVGAAVGLAAWVVAGCTKPGSNSFEEKASELAVVSGSATVVNEPEFMYEGWSIPRSRMVRYRICIVDRALWGAVTVGSFRIEDSKGEKISSISPDGLGCLNWSERYAIHPFLRPTHLETRRRIVSEEGPSKPFELSMAVNPWSGLNGQEPEVLLLDRSRPPRLLSSANALETVAPSASVQTPVRVDAAEGLQVLEHQHGGDRAELQVSLQPYVLVPSYEGPLRPLPIISGSFKTQFFLFERSNHRLVARTDERLFSVTDGRLSVTRLPLNYCEKPRLNGEYELELILTPGEKAPPFLGQARFILPVGAFSHLTGGSNIAILPSDGTQEAKPPNDSASSLSGMACGSILKGRQASDEGFKIVQISGSLARVVAEAETRDRQTRLFDISARLIHATELARDFSGKKFWIRKLGSSSQIPGEENEWIEATLTAGGVIKWSDELSWSTWTNRRQRGADAQGALAVDLMLAPKDQPEQAALHRIQVNFFDPQNSIQDVSNVARAESAVSDPFFRGRPKILIENQLFEPLPTSAYRINAQLDLEIQRELTLTLSPKVLFPADRSKTSLDRENLRAGYYVVTVVLIRPPFLENESLEQRTISAERRVVYSDASSFLKVPLRFSFKDGLTGVLRRTFSFVTIEPADESKLPRGRDGKVDLDLADESRFPADPHILLEVVPSVGALTFNNGGSLSSSLPANIENPQIRVDVQNLGTNSGKLAEVQRAFAESRAKAREADDHRPDLFSVGLQNGLGVVQARNLSTYSSISAAQWQEGLECLHIASWGDEQLRARCLMKPTMTLPGAINALCEFIGKSALSREKLLALKKRADGDESWLEYLTPELLSDYLSESASIQSKCESDPDKFLWVEKRTYIESAPKDVSAQSLGGWGSSLSLRNTAEIAEYPNLAYRSFSITGSSSLPIEVVTDLHGLTQFMPFGKNGKESPRREVESGGSAFPFEAPHPDISPGKHRAGSTPLDDISIAGSVAWNYDSFRWIYNYQVPMRVAVLSNQVQLMVERQRFAVPASTYRECYIIRGTYPADDSHTPLPLQELARTSWNKSKNMICFDTLRPVTIKTFDEDYFFIYQNLPDGVAVDPSAWNAGLFVILRGHRDYLVFMEKLRSKTRFHEVRRAPVEFTSRIQEMRDELMLAPILPQQLVHSLTPRMFAMESMVSHAPPPLSEYIFINTEKISAEQAEAESTASRLRRDLRDLFAPGAGYHADQLELQNDPCRQTSRDKTRQSPIRGTEEAGVAQSTCTQK